MSDKELNLSTIITVIPTIFTFNNRINIQSMFHHIDHQCDKKINTIIILGTTSESSTLSIAEKIYISKSIWNKFNDRLRIIIGVGGTDTMSILNETNKLQNYCDAFLISSPYYNKPTQEGLFQHFNYIISRIPKRFILYNIPSRTSVNIDPETIARINDKFKNKVIGIKESSGNISQVIKLKKISTITILSGDDELSLPLLSIGAVGVISVVSNILPKEMLNLLESFKKGDIKTSVDNFYEIVPFIKACFIETNPAPIKYFLKLKYGFNDKVRLPLVKLNKKNQSSLKKLYYLNFPDSI